MAMLIFQRVNKKNRLRCLEMFHVDIRVGSMIHALIWVNYNELTTSSLEIMVSKGNHLQMALIQVSELL